MACYLRCVKLRAAAATPAGLAVKAGSAAICKKTRKGGGGEGAAERNLPTLHAAKPVIAREPQHRTPLMCRQLGRVIAGRSRLKHHKLAEEDGQDSSSRGTAGAPSALEGSKVPAPKKQATKTRRQAGKVRFAQVASDADAAIVEEDDALDDIDYAKSATCTDAFASSRTIGMPSGKMAAADGKEAKAQGPSPDLQESLRALDRMQKSLMAQDLD